VKDTVKETHLQKKELSKKHIYVIRVIAMTHLIEAAVVQVCFKDIVKETHIYKNRLVKETYVCEKRCSNDSLDRSGCGDSGC